MGNMRLNWREDIDVWASPVMANLLWIVLSLPIVTIPLACSGLLAVMYHWVEDRHTQVFSIFFNTIRKTWHKCYLMLLLDILVAGFLVANLLIFSQMDMNSILPRLSFGMTLLTLIVFIIFNVPAWVLIAVYDAPLKRIIMLAVQLIFVNPFWATVTGVCVLLTGLFAMVLPAAASVIFISALAAGIACRGTQYLLKTYLPASQQTLIKVF